MMNNPMPRPFLRPLVRRIVLGGAILGALVVAFGPYAPAVQAGEGARAPGLATALVVAQAEVGKSAKDTARETAQAAKDAAQVAKDAAQAAKDAAQAAKDEAAGSDDAPTITIDRHGIRVEDAESGAKKHKRVVVGLGSTDREYDSFEQFVHEDRGLAAMVVGIVFIVFLTPVLITGLLIWYKLRKNRMLNDTMMKLAEKGVVPPAEALQALNSGRTAAAVNAMAARAPLVEQAKALRSQAAWSDLRKGVILGAVGLSFIAYSMFDDRSPNWVGLVLLFLGIGYAFLWYFEDRQLAAPASPPPPPPAGGA
jgi:hypothetical protein